MRCPTPRIDRWAPTEARKSAMARTSAAIIYNLHREWQAFHEAQNSDGDRTIRPRTLRRYLRPHRRRPQGRFRAWRGQKLSGLRRRSEEHTLELQSLRRISYAVSSSHKNNTT